MYEYKKCCSTCAEFALICNRCRCLAGRTEFRAKKISTFFCDEYNISFLDWQSLIFELTPEQMKKVRKHDTIRLGFDDLLSMIVDMVNENHRKEENK